LYAVLIEVDLSGVDQEAGLRGLHEQIVPAIRDLPGIQSGTGLPATPRVAACR